MSGIEVVVDSENESPPEIPPVPPAPPFEPAPVKPTLLPRLREKPEECDVVPIALSGLHKLECTVCFEGSIVAAILHSLK